MTTETPKKNIGEWAAFRVEFAACWRALPDKGLFFLLLAVWVALFHFWGNPVLGYMHARSESLFEWLDFVYSTSADDEHGKLVPFVVLWLFWWKRKELLGLKKEAWWPALGLVVGGLVTHAVGFVIQQQRISVVGFFLGLYGLTGLVWGRGWLRASFFPFFIFGFCVPISALSEAVTSPLRIFSTWLTVGVAKLLGVDVIREGSQIYDASRTYLYDVAPACSGIRSIISLAAVTTIYGFMQFRQPWQRAVMVGLALPLALAGNVARLTAVILTAEMFGQEAGAWVEQKLGMVTFVVAVGAVFLFGRWLQRRTEVKA